MWKIFETETVYWKQEKQKKCPRNDFVPMEGRSGWKAYKKANIYKCYEGQQFVESHNHTRPKEIWCVEEKYRTSNFLTLSNYFKLTKIAVDSAF